MKIQDAIKSGRPFKIPAMHDFLYVKKEPSSQVDFFYWMMDHTMCKIFPVDAILSENWFLMEMPDNLLTFKPKLKLVTTPESKS